MKEALFTLVVNLGKPTPHNHELSWNPSVQTRYLCNGLHSMSTRVEARHDLLSLFKIKFVRLLEGVREMASKNEFHLMHQLCHNMQKQHLDKDTDASCGLAQKSRNTLSAPTSSFSCPTKFSASRCKFCMIYELGQSRIEIYMSMHILSVY